MTTGPGAGTVVATANVLYTLGHDEAAACLAAVLAEEPDLVGLQEWYPRRTALLGRCGPGYRWSPRLLGGCVVGARRDRFELVRSRTVPLSPPGRADRPGQWLGLEPPRLAAVAVYRDLLVDRTVCLVDYHLVSGVQLGGHYREDRPRLVDRHRRELRALERLVAGQRARGHVVYAVGDSNLDGLRLPGLTSAWDGRAHEPGTLGPHRHVDDVHGPGPAERVTLLETPSDHRAVVVRRPD